MSRRWQVTTYEITARVMTIEAATEAEAIEIGESGEVEDDHTHTDSDPDNYPTTAEELDTEECATCPECGPGWALSGGEEAEPFHCTRCKGRWSVGELDATSAYRQAYIDGDAVAERIRERAQP